MNEDGVEVKVLADGTKQWLLYGVLHRDDGPAVEFPTGEQWWFQYGKEHRDDGPAIIRPNGSNQWFRDGKCHREDGPAIERADGWAEWWLNGERWFDGPTILARQKAATALALGLPKNDGVEIKVESDGTKQWLRYGVLHRDDGPAVERPDGETRWYQFGKEHREGGPAIERADGSKEWLRHGKHHREDGPATESRLNTPRWYLNGEDWPDGPSVVARRKAEQARALKMAQSFKPK